MNPRHYGIWPFRPAKPVPVTTASEAARILGNLGREAKANRTAMLCELRREVRECDITPLGWRA
jgi:hypothetical protein